MQSHGPQVFDYPGELLLRHWLTVSAEPLTKGVQMWGGIESGAQPGRAKHRVAHRRRAALALGSGYMDCWYPTVRAAQTFQKGLHPLQVIDRLLPRTFNPTPLCVEKGHHLLDGFPVLHHNPGQLSLLS